MSTPGNPASLIAEVLRLRAEGQTYTEIGTRLQCSKNVVAGICHRAKATMPRKTKVSRLKARLRNPAVIAKARGLWCLGHTFADIAKAVRLPRRCVETMRYREGWPGKMQPRKAAEPERAACRPQALPAMAPQFTAVAGHAYATERRCVFPFGEPRTPGFRFCDAPVTRPGSYCDPCRAVCYGKNTAAIMETPGRVAVRPGASREQSDDEDRQAPAADCGDRGRQDQGEHTPAVGRGASRGRARLAPAPGAAA